MTGALQTYARKWNKAIDLISFSFDVKKDTDPTLIKAAPEDGIYIYGLYIEGAKWSIENEILED